MVLRAAGAYDHRSRHCGAEANAAKYFAAEAGHQRLRDRDADPWRHGLRQGIPRRTLLPRSLIARIAPVMPQLILSHIGERVLGLPKSI